MTIDSYAAGAVLVAASALAAVAGLILLRRFGYFRSLIISHEASGQYLAIVGTLYAVLLGLIVVDAMGRFQAAATLVGDETNAMAELVYLSGRMPEPQKGEIRRRLTEYANLVVDREWEILAQGRHLPEARRACLELMRVVRDWEPATESEKAIYAEAIEAASDFWNARRMRIISSQRGIPPLEWCAVILGGVVTVGLTYFLVLDDLRIQIALTAMVAVLISLNIFLILMFAYPFSGDLRVSNEGFHVALAGLALESSSPRR
ncbi:MAG: bestrophin-like domain [Isosphaeraceae bacterium]